MPFIFILCRVEVASGTGLAPVAQPLLHRRDLVALPDDDPFAQDRDVLTGTVGRRPARHDDRLRVMRNHAGHELDVGVAVWQVVRFGAGRRRRRGRRATLAAWARHWRQRGSVQQGGSSHPRQRQAASAHHSPVVRLVHGAIESAF